MIASFSNNFIFLKTRKTGGTSVELVLRSWCVPSDFCTRIGGESVRKEFGEIEPRKWHGWRRLKNHSRARTVRAAFRPFWGQAYKFTIERHPYEKVVSRVYWNIAQQGGDPVNNFDEVLAHVLARRKYLDRDVYMIGNKIAVDEVIKYDTMWDRLAELGREWGKSLPDQLPSAKAGYRKDRRPARDILSARDKASIQKVAAFEFETFGFEP